MLRLKSLQAINGIAYLIRVGFSHRNEFGDRVAVPSNDERCALPNLLDKFRQMRFRFKGSDFVHQNTHQLV